jgi:hypothetical protein
LRFVNLQSQDVFELPARLHIRKILLFHFVANINNLTQNIIHLLHVTAAAATTITTTTTTIIIIIITVALVC